MVLLNTTRPFDCCSSSHSLSECKCQSHEGEAEAALPKMKGRLAWFSVGFASWEFEQIQQYSASVPLKPGAHKLPYVCGATADVINGLERKTGASQNEVPFGCLNKFQFHNFKHDKCLQNPGREIYDSLRDR